MEGQPRSAIRQRDIGMAGAGIRTPAAEPDQAVTGTGSRHPRAAPALWLRQRRRCVDRRHRRAARAALPQRKCQRTKGFQAMSNTMAAAAPKGWDIPGTRVPGGRRDCGRDRGDWRDDAPSRGRATARFLLDSPPPKPSRPTLRANLPTPGSEPTSAHTAHHRRRPAGRAAKTPARPPPLRTAGVYGARRLFGAGTVRGVHSSGRKISESAVFWL